MTREALKLTFIGDLSFQEVGEIIGVTLTVGAKQFIVPPKFQFDDSSTGVLFCYTTNFKLIYTV